MSLQDTPRANRLHIGIFGNVNSGKSTLINALTSQEIAVVSDVAGTTTDPIYKAMELHGIGPVVFIDTAGSKDDTELGSKRLEKTKDAANKTDIALVIFADDDIQEGLNWIDYFNERKTKTITVINKIDEQINVSNLSQKIEDISGLTPIVIDAKQKQGIEEVKDALIRSLPEDYEVSSITAHLIKKEDVVMLVMPQDIQAPKGRLILPQVQTIRDLLDQKCIVVSCTMDTMEASLKALMSAPKLIICDSQVFPLVFKQKPDESKLTSFSILFAQYKGDLDAFIKGTEIIESLQNSSKVLIAEACTHAPLTEDIGRVKIPAMLRKKFGKDMQIDIVSGIDFPTNLESYDLIIHCGACMFNRKYVLSRIEKAKQAGVPISNYGVVIASLSGILGHISK